MFIVCDYTTLFVCVHDLFGYVTAQSAKMPRQKPIMRP